ncbi:MAG: FtsX-like permease family protein [Streptosporangiaceae bacterium]
MIWLGLRLLFAGGRQAMMIVALTVVGVATGCALLLLALSAPAALQARADRTAWQPGGSEVTSSTVGRYTAMLATDQFSPYGSISTVWLASSQASSPTFPGLEHNPGPGECFVSPALRSLLRTSPELSARYGPVTGTVGPQVLVGPDTLMVVRYLPESRMDPAQRELVTRFATHGTSLQYAPALVRLLVAAAVVLILTPIVLFVATVTRLSVASRERRLSALRLAGATRAQVGYLTAVESLLAGLGGAALGLLLFAGSRPWAARISASGEPWFRNDLDPGALGYLTVIIGVPVLVALSTQLTLVRVNTSPLGAAQRTRPRRLRAWRLAPLLVCFCGGALVLVAGRKPESMGSGPTLALVMIALLSVLPAGPYLILFLGRLASAGTGGKLLAGARMVDDPRGAFRAAATVTFAIIAGTVFTATTPAAVASVLPNDRLSGLHTGVASIDAATGAPTADLVSRLRQVAGISEVAAVHVGRAAGDADATVWIADCTVTARLVQIHAESCGERSVLVTDRARPVLGSGSFLQVANLAAARPGPEGTMAPMITLKIRLPAPTRMTAPTAYDTPAIVISPRLVEARDLAQIRPNLVLIRYESADALERARTVVDHATPGRQLLSGPETVTGNTEGARRVRAALLIATLSVFVLAGAGLVISTSIGLLQRRRQYALLRMTGVPISVLRGAMVWETALPLAVAGLLATGLGLIIATALLGTVGMTPPMVWALVWPLLGGYGLALTTTAFGLPVIRRVTDIEALRFDDT